MHWSLPIFILWTTSLTQLYTVLAWRTIAHRGVSRDANDRYALPESTVEAMQRAADFGMPGLEFNIRMTQDGIPIVVHDYHGARETIEDGLGGLSNPVDAALHTQPSSSILKYSSFPFSFWKHIPFKAYGRGSRILPSTQKLESLDDMLHHLKDLQKPDFLLFLDIQSSDTFRASAAVIKKHKMGNQVLLKFFVNTALDSEKYKYTGPETCALIARHEGFEDLQLVPQFNNRQMAIADGQAFVDVLQTRLPITRYLDCWLNVSSIQMPMVAASVPRSTDENIPYIKAAVTALEWASSHNLRRMAILPNPSVGRFTAGKCTWFVFNNRKIRAKSFGVAARNAKLYFARRMLRADDLLVGDVMGDLEHQRWSIELGFYTENLC